MGLLSSDADADGDGTGRREEVSLPSSWKSPVTVIMVDNGVCRSDSCQLTGQQINTFNAGGCGHATTRLFSS